MKYTTTVLALAVVTAKSVDGQRRNFRTVKDQMRRRELQGSMSMLTEYKGSSSSSSSDETESCAELLTGSWAALDGPICKLFTITDGTIETPFSAAQGLESVARIVCRIEKDCSGNQAFTFDVDSDGTLQMTSNFIRLSNGELEEATLIGFINDKDDTCSFKAASISTTATIEGSVGEDGVLHVELTKPGGVENGSAGAFQGPFTKIPEELLPNPEPFCFADGEECRTTANPDTVNGGCSSSFEPPEFGSIVPGKPVCGTLSTYVVKEGRKRRNFRDVDEYKFTWAGGTLAATLKANFGFGLIVLGTLNGGVGCENATAIEFEISGDEDSTDITLFADLDPGEYVWALAGDGFGVLFGDFIGDFNECGGKKGNDYTFSYDLSLTEIEASGSAGNGDISWPAAEGPTTYDDE